MSLLSIPVHVAALGLVLAASALSPTSAQTTSERRVLNPALETTQADARLQLMDAERTRQAFMEILRRHPPAVGRILKLDPSLMQNDSYLQTYPQIREFLQQHPEVRFNAPYFFEQIRADFDHGVPSPRERMVEGILAGLAGFTAFIIILSTIVWLVRTAVEHRRWNRLSRIQAEVHTKLMDRFSSNDDLLTYVQTPSGRRFLESGPSPLQESAPAMSAPFTRILWSVQLGAVLLVSGMGLLFLSDRAIQEARELFYIAGCLATALGAGFIVSAAAAYILSRRLGLLDRPTHEHA